MRVTVPSSTWGRMTSCWALLKRWISSTNRMVALAVHPSAVAGFGDDTSQVGHAGGDGADRLEGGLGNGGHEPGEGGLARAGRPPEDEGGQTTGGDGAEQDAVTTRLPAADRRTRRRCGGRIRSASGALRSGVHASLAVEKGFVGSVSSVCHR